MSNLTITGTGRVDSLLRLTTADGRQVDGADVSGVQWFKNGVAIDGATGLTYTPSVADLSSKLSVHLVYKGVDSVSDQRAIDAQPTTDMLLWNNAALSYQYDMDLFQTVANLRDGLPSPVGTLIVNSTQSLVTVDSDHNGQILRVDNSTMSYSLYDKTTGAVQEVRYPVGLETPEARLAADFRILSSKLDIDGNGQEDILSVANGHLFVNDQTTNGQSVNNPNQLLFIDNETNSLTANGGYVVKGVADFDGNGTDDILLFNASHNALEVLQMSDTTVVARTAIATLPTGYSLVNIADGSGDGKTDILIRDTQGRLENYQMRLDQVDGKEVLNAVLSPVDTQRGIIPNEYEIISRVDFNLDGKQDILWENKANGQTWASIVDGNSLIATNLIESYSDWDVKAVVTDNITGKPELVFQNTLSGSTAFVDMTGVNGTELGATEIVNYGSDWQIDQSELIELVGLSNGLNPVIG